MSILLKYDCICNAAELQEYLEYYGCSGYSAAFYESFFIFLTEAESDFTVVRPDSVLDQVKYRGLKSEFEHAKEENPKAYSKDEHFIDFARDFCPEEGYYFLTIDDNYGVYYIESY